MALSNLAGWNEEKAASACGAACGASDKPAIESLVPWLPSCCQRGQGGFL